MPAAGEVAFEGPFEVPAAFVFGESAFEEAAAPGEEAPPFDEAGDTAAFEEPAFLFGVAGLEVPAALEVSPAFEEPATDDEPPPATDEPLPATDEEPPTFEPATEEPAAVEETAEEPAADTAEAMFEVP